IHDELVTAAGKATFYRDVRDLATEMPTLHDDAIAAMQADAKMAMRKNGVIILDDEIYRYRKVTEKIAPRGKTQEKVILSSP
ncbi:MAG: hypothetical protein Q6373_020570, partial [Candidatus Sigynarchaeota archaeon]